jgi:release factor glutamine methyltransferase
MPTLTSFEADHKDVYEPAEDTYLLLDALQSQSKCLASLEPRLAVEIGPGSGVVSSFVALMLPGIAVLAIDANPAAVAAALATADDNGVQDRVSARQGDLCIPLLPRAVDAPHDGEEAGRMSGWDDSCLQGGEAGVEVVAAAVAAATRDGGGIHADIMVFNPPYVPTEDEEVDSSEIAKAWAGGERGRRVIDRFMPMLPRVLAKPHGCAYMVVVQENDPKELAGIAAAAGLCTVGVASCKAANERLSILKFHWPGDSSKEPATAHRPHEAHDQRAGLPVLGTPDGGLSADKTPAA